MNSPEVSKRTSNGEAISGHIDVDRKDVSLGEESQVTRRSFCNDLLLTSAGLILAARTIAGETLTQQESLLAFPQMKIEGAEKLMPGSSLYFNYPTRSDPAVLVRVHEGEHVAYSRKCSHGDVRLNWTPPADALSVLVIREYMMPG